MSGELDLAQPGDVLRYLAGTPFTSSRVEALSGGTANYIFRLYLERPYMGMQTLVLKHGKAWLPADRSFSLSLERQKFEALALKKVNAVLPADALARAPTLHHHDPHAHVLIMDDCGVDARTLKQLIQDNSLDVEACRVIGRALGTFLATVHRECTRDEELMRELDGNEEMKRLSAGVTYGRLVGTLNGERRAHAGGLLFDPPLVESLPDARGTVETVGTIARETARAIVDADAESVLTMGDFWTGNIVVRTHTDANANNNSTQPVTVERIFVIDWELTKPGLPFLDVGQFVAEMHTLRRFHEASATKLVDAALNEYYAAYRAGYPPAVDEVYLRGATAHVGAHLLAWTAVAGWEPKERVREVALQGVGYLVASRQETLEALKRSSIISLLDDDRNI